MKRHRSERSVGSIDSVGSEFHSFTAKFAAQSLDVNSAAMAFSSFVGVERGGGGGRD